MNPKSGKGSTFHYALRQRGWPQLDRLPLLPGGFCFGVLGRAEGPLIDDPWPGEPAPRGEAETCLRPVFAVPGLRRHSSGGCLDIPRHPSPLKLCLFNAGSPASPAFPDSLFESFPLIPLCSRPSFHLTGPTTASSGLMDLLGQLPELRKALY